MYTNENWFEILLSCVYFGDLITEIRHFSLLKTNKIAHNSKQLCLLVLYLTLVQNVTLSPIIIWQNWTK